MRERTFTRRCALWASIARSSLFCFLLVTDVGAEPGSEYDHAVELLAHGNHEQAAAAFVAAADAVSEGERAADSLFAAARLYENRLDKPQIAAQLYARIVREHPNSRVSLAAQRRLGTLTPLLDGKGGAGALARWNTALQGFADRSPEETRSMALQILQEYPDWPGRFDVLIWLAEQAQNQGEYEEALRLLGRARQSSRGPRDDLAVTRREVEVLSLQGRFERAITLVEDLEQLDDPGSRRIAEDARSNILRTRRRKRFFDVAILIIIIASLGLLISLHLAAGSTRGMLRELSKPPAEAWFALPPSLLLIAMALASYREVGPAVALIVTAGLSLTVLSGVALRVAPPSLWRTASHVGLTVAGVLASIYVALHMRGLLDQILETVRLGPDI